MPTSHPLRLPACGGSSPALWVLTFRLGIGFFAVPRSALREIRDWTRSGFPRRMRSPAPCPLVDLRFLTGHPNTPPEKDFELLVLESSGRRVAVLADQAGEVILAPAPVREREAPPPEGLILGVVEHRGLPFLLLNPEALISRCSRPRDPASPLPEGETIRQTQGVTNR